MRNFKRMLGVLVLLGVAAGGSLCLHGSEVQKPALPNIRIAAYFTGADAGAKIAAAIADLPSTGGTVDARGLEGAQTISSDMFGGITKPVTLLLGATTLSLSATQTVNIETISILGLGPGITAINSSVNGDAFRVRTSPFVARKAGTIAGFTLNGNAGANAVGVHAGDIGGLHLESLEIRNFTGTSGSGLWLDNTTNWTERLYLLDCWLSNNTVGLRFTVNGGTTSFLYNHFSGLHINTNAGQTGILSQNNAAVHGIFLEGNINDDAADASSTAISVAGTSTWHESNIYRFTAEDTGGGGGTGLSVAAGASFDGSGWLQINGLTNSLLGTVKAKLPNLSGTNTYGIVESRQTVSARLGSNDLGTYLIPQLEAAGSFHHGIGFNLHFDGTNWKTENDGTNNGGAAVLADFSNPTTLKFFVVNSSATGADQTISDATLNSTHLHARLTPTGLGLRLPSGTGNPTSTLDVRVGDIRLGFDRAETAQFLKTFTTAHAAANVPSQLNVGMDDGAFAGMQVRDVRNGGNTFNDQSLQFHTGEGGVSAANRLTIAKDGIITPGASGQDFGSASLRWDLFGQAVNSSTYATATNCADGAGAAACGSAAAGAVVIDAGSTSVVVSTTAVTANSRIVPVFDASLGTELSVTCNTTFAAPWISAKTASTSFTISVAVAPAVNPGCFTFVIVD